MEAEQEPSEDSRCITSARPLGDIPDSDEPTPDLMKATLSGDTQALESFLSTEEGKKSALLKTRFIWKDDDGRNDPKDPDQPRAVYVTAGSNIERALLKAVANRQSSAYTCLVSFAAKYGLDAEEVYASRPLKVLAIRHNYADVFKAIVTAYPPALTKHMGHYERPLDLAINHVAGDVVEVILQLGAGLALTELSSCMEALRVGFHAPIGRAMCRLTGSRIKMLVQHHPRNGALHNAASLGQLHGIRAVMSEGADVNERYLNVSTTPARSQCEKNAVMESWTPLHYAAADGHLEAMELLQSYGALPDIQDNNGRTPAQLLEEHRQAKGSAAQ